MLDGTSISDIPPPSKLRLKRQKCLHGRLPSVWFADCCGREGSSCQATLPGQVRFNSRGFVIESRVSRLRQHYNIHIKSVFKAFKAVISRSDLNGNVISDPKLHSRCAVEFPVQCQVSPSALSVHEGNPGKSSVSLKRETIVEWKIFWKLKFISENLFS